MITAAYYFLVVTICLLPWALGGVATITYLMLALVVGCTVLALVVDSVLRKRAVPPIPSLGWCLIAAMALGVFQLLPLPTTIVGIISPQRLTSVEGSRVDQQPTASISESKDSTTLELSRLWVMTLVLVAASMSVKYFKNTVIILTVNGVLFALFGIAQRLSWNGHIYWKIKSPSFYSFASFINHNNAGGYLCLLLACAATTWLLAIETNEHFLKSLKKRTLVSLVQISWKDLAVAAAVLLLVVSVLLTASRGAFLAMILGSVVFLKAIREKRPIRWSLFAIVLSALFVVHWTNSSRLVWPRLNTIITGTNLGVRTLHWRDDLSLLNDYWAVGCGLGAYRNSNHPYQSFSFSNTTTDPVSFRYSENQYLESAIVGGIPGLCILAVTIFIACRGTILLLKRTDHVPYLRGVLAAGAIASQAVAATFDFGLYLSANASLLALICGFSCATADQIAISRKRDMLGWLVLLAIGVFALPCLVGQSLIDKHVNAHEVALSRSYHARRSMNEVSSEINALSQALTWFPNSVEGNIGLAELFLEKNQVQVFEDLRANCPSIPETVLWSHANLASLHHKIYRGELTGEQLEHLTANPAIRENVLKAWNALQTATNCCPLNVKCYYYMSLTRALATGTQQPSLDLLSRAAELSPQNSNTQLKLASVAMAEGLRQFGIKRLAKSIETAGEINEQHVRFANDCLSPSELKNCLGFVDTKSPIQTETALKTASANHRDVILASTVDAIGSSNLENCEKCYARHRAFLAANVRDKALDQLTLAIESSPGSTTWRHELAKQLAKDGSISDALRQARICVSLAPDNTSFVSLQRRLERQLKKRKR